MKKWSIIIAAGLVGAWLLIDAVRDFLANDPIQYFSAYPKQMLCVTAIAVIGGLLAFLCARLSPHAQRLVKIFAWGAGALAATAGYGIWIFYLYSYFSQFSAHVWVLPSILANTATIAYLWFEFYRAWKPKR